MYITVEELGVPEEMLIRLTDDEGSGMVNTARAEDAIISAQAHIDAALSARFDTPLPSQSELVKTLTRDIAVYYLYLRAGAVPEQVAASYAAASEMLEKASAGLFHLGLSETCPGPSLDYRDREFTREYMEGF